MTTTIPNLPALKARLHELSMQKARYGISADPHISIELRDLESVIHLMERIDIHRRNLTHMLGQRGHFGANVPTHIANQIDKERGDIATLRQQCSQLGHLVETHPVDADDAPAVEVTRPAPVRATETQLDRIERKLDELLRRLS